MISNNPAWISQTRLDTLRSIRPKKLRPALAAAGALITRRFKTAFPSARALVSAGKRAACGSAESFQFTSFRDWAEFTAVPKKAAAASGVLGQNSGSSFAPVPSVRRGDLTDRAGAVQALENDRAP